MKRSALLSIFLALSACVVSVDPETGTFACADDGDCVDGYVCVAQVCVQKSGGGNGDLIPDTFIEASPPAFVSEPFASYIFGSSPPGLQLECDFQGPTGGGGFVACEQDALFELDGQGDYWLSVRAVSPQGVADPSPASHSFVADFDAPTVVLSSSNTGSVYTFTFSCSDNLTGCETFCDIGSGVHACSGSETYNITSPSTFQVYARDGAGNQSPADQRSITPDSTPPWVTLTSVPGSPSSGSTAHFEFYCQDTESGCASMTCTLDGEVVDPCTSPFDRPGLVPGSHSFRVRATDGAGNVGADNTHDWSIDLLWNEVAVGPMFSCGIAADRSLWCWGDRMAIDGAALRWSSQFPQWISGPSEWNDLGAGWAHACGIRHATSTTVGALYCWGQNGNGQLGLNDTNPRFAPSRVGPSDSWRKVEAGGAFTCALDAGGDLYCWGQNDYGQVGDGTTQTRHIPWPVNEPVAGMAWTTFAVGEISACAISVAPDSNLYCWGGNGNGQVGNGSYDPAWGPQLVGTYSDKWIDVAMGRGHTCAIKVGGALYCWGSSSRGQLGYGTGSTYTSPQPTQVGYTWQNVYAGGDTTCARTNAGSIYCFGNNDSGQLANSSLLSGETAVSIGGSAGWRSASVGLEHVCALDNNARVSCWGNRNLGQLGNGTGLSAGPRFPVIDAPGSQLFVQGAPGSFDAGLEHSCAVSNDNRLFCFGWDGYGQLGDEGSDPNGSTNMDPPSSFVSGDRALGVGADGYGWQRVTAGYYHSCGIIGGQLYCWGNNGWGQLGLGDYFQQATPYAVGTQLDWLEVDAAVTYTCGVRGNGGSRYAYCWGSNANGQLGVSGVGESTTPLQVSGFSDWRFIRTGDHHTCGLRGSATGGAELWCWGYNVNGELGTGVVDGIIYTPTRESTGRLWMQLATGHWHTCAVRDDGTLWCWGLNNFQQLGNAAGSTGMPQQVGTDMNWWKVAVTEYGTCALRTNGTLWCWGENGFGQLGPEPMFVSQPRQVDGSADWTDLAAGISHVCVRDGSGRLYCMGNNHWGQLGDGQAFQLWPDPLF